MKNLGFCWCETFDGLDVLSVPRAGSVIVRIDPLRFLVGCPARRLNQVLSVLSLSLDFLSMSVVLLTRVTFLALCCFVLFVCSASNGNCSC